MIDILFLFDILVNFISAIEDENFQIVDDRSICFKEYMKGWFIIDVVAIMPFDLMF